jgi:hypothetical protein
MKNTLTRDLLKIFWHGEEGSGLTIYAYATQPDSPPSFPLDLWPKDALFKTSKLFGDGWLVWVWDLRVDVWPIEWKETLRLTLVGLCVSGTPVVWCGLEGCFADPPDLLSPAAMANCVYAASSSATGFICHTDIDKTFVALHEQELHALKSQLRS